MRGGQGRPVRGRQTRRAGYPRLAAAWALLVGAPSLAFGDATVPRPAPAKREPAPPKMAGKPKAPDPAPPRPPEVPHLQGDIARANPPLPPGLEIHAHAPGEPCRRRMG